MAVKRNHLKQTLAIDWQTLDSQFSDTVDFPDGPPSGIWVTTAGNIQMLGANGLVTIAVAAGQIYPFCPRRIYSTLTTASGIIGLY